MGDATGGTDNQTLSINTTTNLLSLESGGGVDLTDYRNHTGTAGSVFFAGTNGKPTEDNANLFWDNVTKRLGIGTTPTAPLTIKPELFGTVQRGILIESNVDDNLWAAISIKGGDTETQRRYIEFLGHDGVRTNQLGCNKQNAFIFWDATLGYHPLFFGGNGPNSGSFSLSSSRENNIPVDINHDGTNVVSDGGVRILDGQGSVTLDHQYAAINKNGVRVYNGKSLRVFHADNLNYIALHAGSAYESYLESKKPLVFKAPEWRWQTSFASSTMQMKLKNNLLEILGGDISVSGHYKDSAGDIGTAGQLLSSTATGTDWIDAPSPSISQWKLTNTTTSPTSNTTKVAIGKDEADVELDVVGEINALKIKSVGDLIFGDGTRLKKSGAGIQLLTSNDSEIFVASSSSGAMKINSLEIGIQTTAEGTLAWGEIPIARASGVIGKYKLYSNTGVGDRVAISNASFTYTYQIQKSETGAIQNTGTATISVDGKNWIDKGTASTTLSILPNETVTFVLDQNNKCRILSRY